MSDVNKESTEIAISSSGSVRGAIDSLSRGEVAMFSTIAADTFDEKRRVLSLMTNAKSLASEEMLGKPINLRNIIVQAVEIADEQTGEVNEQPRIILVDDEDNAYSAISNGLIRSIESIMSMFGHPSTWEGAIPVEVVEKRGRSGFRFYTLNIL